MINLRQMAEDEVVFKFESDEDKREFWELYIENNGSKYSNRNLTDILMQDNTTHFKIFIYHNEIFYAYSNNSWKYPTWTQIKERYKMKDWTEDKSRVGDRIVKSDTIPVKTVQCSWQKESNEMDLKSIAVRFENFEQYEAIIEKFKDSGFELSSAENVYSSGEVGYTSSCDYVCVLTESALQGKKIISYEQFIGGKEMKRLDIRKDHKSEKGIVVHCNSDIETVVKLLNDKADVITTLLIGKRGVSLKMANEIIKLFNIPYELYESTDWNKVEEGAEVRYSIDLGNGMGQGGIGNFYDYIPNLNKIILIVGNDVIAVDEDEVELV